MRELNYSVFLAYMNLTSFETWGLSYANTGSLVYFTVSLRPLYVLLAGNFRKSFRSILSAYRPS